MNDNLLNSSNVSADVLPWHTGPYKLFVCYIARDVEDAEEGTIVQHLWMIFTDWQVRRCVFLVK